jgi:hypothetical protein
MVVPFALKTIQNLRKRAARAGRIADTGPEGWAKSEVDPGEIVRVFKRLRVRPGFRLRAYQFRAGENGNGIVYALPDGYFPDPADCRSRRRTALGGPAPKKALPFFMDAIEGDGSPLSYVSASLLLRELCEFGALWHGTSWSDQTLLGADPRGEIISDTEEWFWHRENIAWRPSVACSKASMVASFYTFTGLEQKRVICHEDTYQPGSYSPECRSEVVASGPMGYIH